MQNNSLDTSKTKLGILAGGGTFPQSLIHHCITTHRPFFVIAFEGHTDPSLFESRFSIPALPHKWCAIGKLGTVIETLKQENCQELVLIGSIKRPSFRDLKTDGYTAKLILKFGFSGKGDDGLLTFLVKELEQENFTVKGIHDILPREALFLGKGLCTASFPSTQDLEDIKRGATIAYALGKVDVGQSVIVDHGLVLGVEAIEGTDALIRRAAEVRKLHNSLSSSTKHGVLIKLSKPGQETRTDLPTLGPNTLNLLDTLGFKGIAFEAHKTLFVDQSKCVEIANKRGLFLLGITVDSHGNFSY